MARLLRKHTKLLASITISAGGVVDFPAMFKVLHEKHGKGCAILETDAPREADDGYDSTGGDEALKVDLYFVTSINLFRDGLGVNSLLPG